MPSSWGGGVASYACVEHSSDPRARPLAEYLLASSGPYALAATVITAVVLTAAYRWLATRLGRVELALGFLLAWLGLSVTATAVAPVGASLFQWPTLAAAIAWLWLLAGSARSSAVLIVPGVVAVVLLTPQLLLSFFGGGVAVLPELAIAALLLGLVVPALTELPLRSGVGAAT